MQPITRILARHVVDFSYASLPSAVQHEGLRAFVNYIGCAAGGSHEPHVELMVKFLAEFNGAADTTLIGRREKLDALNATFINCMSSAALAFNDTHYATVAHPTSPVAAALLAMAQRQKVSGQDLLYSLILGVEIQCRVGGILTTPPAESAVGLSMQGLVGGIGAAVAAGKLLGLDEAGMVTAIGHAANQSAGIRQGQSTDASHFSPAHAARCGLQAALLAAHGFECSDNMLEGPKGFAVSFAKPPNLEAAIANLGQSFEISTLAYKPYPSGVVIHSIIDACLDIVQQKNFDAAEIERIDLTLNPLAAKLTDLVEPKDRGQALVSLQHWAVVTLVYKQAGIAEVSNNVVRDPAISALRKKVSYTNDNNVGREAAHVRVTLKDGTTLAASVQHCRGSVKRPLTDDDITSKARGQLRTVFAPDTAEKILEQSWGMASCVDVNEFCGLLAI